MPSDPRFVVVTDPRIPTDRYIFEGIDVSREPVFSISEVSKFFFARSPDWIRWRERKGFFVLDGQDVGGYRTEEGARRYSLSDVEKMAHSLAEKEAINGAQLTVTLILLQTQAKLWGYIS